MSRASREDILQAFLASQGVSTDTRTLAPGQVFFALKGPSFDGNEYVEEAFERGASYVVSDDHPQDHGLSSIFLVDNALEALQNLALDYRRTLSIPVLAVTGSNGKTTNKELLFSVLSQKFNVWCTQGNLNNHIGVPLTVLSARAVENVEFLIVEMGANHKGDILELCRIAEPTHGLITNVGKAHLEGFGGLEGVRQGKGELFYYLQAHGGVFFGNDLEYSIDYLPYDRSTSVGELLKLNNWDDAVVLSDSPLHVRCGSDDVVIPALHGAHQWKNVSNALAVASYFGVEKNLILTALENYLPPFNRYTAVRLGSNEVILDAYNANPSSMQASIAAFLNMTVDSRERLIILGEMLEMGAHTHQEHFLLATSESLENIECWFFGSGYENAIEFDKYDNKRFFRSFDELNKAFKRVQDRKIFIKGSRGNGLEKLVEK